MNILVCSGSDSSYNSLRPEHEIYVSLAKQGVKITILTHQESEYFQRFLDHGIDAIAAPITKKLSLRSILLIRKIVKEKSIDIVYATNSKAIPNAAIACIGLKAKLVAYRGTASGLYWHDPGNYLSMYNPRLDGIICVSNYVYKFVKSKWLLRNKSIASIYKGHDIGWYDKQAAELSEFGIKDSDFTVICVINSRPHKGLDVILNAANQLANFKDLHILLVGRGVDKEPYKSLLENNKMRENIHVAGYRTDAPELIAASSVLVQPSISGEGLPRVILESLAYNTPVITSANEGSLEIIDHEYNGLVVPIKDDAALAEAIIKLYHSPELLHKLQANCHAKLENELSHKQTVANYRHYFEKIISA